MIDNFFMRKMRGIRVFIDKIRIYLQSSTYLWYDLRTKRMGNKYFYFMYMKIIHIENFIKTFDSG